MGLVTLAQYMGLVTLAYNQYLGLVTLSNNRLEFWTTCSCMLLALRPFLNSYMGLLSPDHYLGLVTLASIFLFNSKSTLKHLLNRHLLDGFAKIC